MAVQDIVERVAAQMSDGGSSYEVFSALLGLDESPHVIANANKASRIRGVQIVYQQLLQFRNHEAAMRLILSRASEMIRKT